MGIARLTVRRVVQDFRARAGEARAAELALEELGGRREPGGALDPVEARELPDRLERRLPVDARLDRGGNRIRPEGDAAVLRRDGARDEEERRRGDGSFYETTLNGTTAPVFSQTIAIFPPWSVMSTNAIVNWSTETAGVTMFIGTFTTSNFAS